MLELLMCRPILVHCSFFEQRLHQDSSLAKQYIIKKYTVPISPMINPKERKTLSVSLIKDS